MRSWWKRISSRDEDYRANDREFAGIVKNYLKYESGKMDLNAWVEEALRRISHLRDVDPKNEYLSSGSCAYLSDRRNRRMRQNGFWSRTIITGLPLGRDVELSSYYLYLTTLFSPMIPSASAKVAEELSKSFMKHPDSWKILCMLVRGGFGVQDLQREAAGAGKAVL